MPNDYPLFKWVYRACWLDQGRSCWFSDSSRRQVIVCSQSIMKSNTGAPYCLSGNCLDQVDLLFLYGFCTAKEQVWLELFLRRCKRSGYCTGNTPTVEELCAASDTKLFQLVVADPQHMLHSLLPPESTIAYNLRPRAHNLTLPDKHCALDSCNFVTRMLYANCYWLCSCYFILLSFMSAAAVCHLHHKRRYIGIDDREAVPYICNSGAKWILPQVIVTL